MATPAPLPIKLYGSVGPNPAKISILLSLLSLPHETIPIPISSVKDPSYTSINPNGRLPALHDPNTSLTLWESGAILEYLVSQYDSTSHALSFPSGSNESYLVKQWLYFQASGQGPYYGQAVWFERFHEQKLPSARERYVKEVNRVSGVLDAWLREQEGGWLVGGRMSVADLAFVPWQVMVPLAFGKKEDFDEERYPCVKEWVGRMMAIEAVREVMERVVEAAKKRV